MTDEMRRWTVPVPETVAAAAPWVVACILRPDSRRYGVAILTIACVGGLWASALVVALAEPQPTVLLAFRTFGAFVSGFGLAIGLGALVALPLRRKSVTK